MKTAFARQYATQRDICYGPIAPGQFFIDRLNPQTPRIIEIKTVLTDDGAVFVCQIWGMNEDHAVWSFGPRPNEGGWQIAKCNIERMERVSRLAARHFAEQELRHRDDEWRARYAPTHEPIKITRCSCGVGDYAGRPRHAIGCFLRGEVL